MKTTITISLVITILFLGCSHTYVVRTDSSRFSQLQQEAKNKKAKVTLKDSRFYPNVRLTQLSPDSTSWALPNGEVMSALTEEIFEIRFIKRGSGAWQGFGLGLLAGILTGGIIGFADGDDPEGFLSFTADEKAVFGAILIGPLGGLIGIPVGAVIGSKDIYQFEHESPQSTTTRKSSVQ